MTVVTSLPVSYSSVSFLLSILAMTSLSSLAFSSLGETNDTDVKKRWRPSDFMPSDVNRAAAQSPPVQRRGFMSRHRHQLGKQVWSSDAGISRVNWESFDQRGTWRSTEQLYLHVEHGNNNTTNMQRSSATCKHGVTEETRQEAEGREATFD